MAIRTLALIGGATGRSGQQVINEALSRGYSLRVLARTPQKVKSHEKITVIEGGCTQRREFEYYIARGRMLLFLH